MTGANRFILTIAIKMTVCILSVAFTKVKQSRERNKDKVWRTDGPLFNLDTFHLSVELYCTKQSSCSDCSFEKSVARLVTIRVDEHKIY